MEASHIPKQQVTASPTSSVEKELNGQLSLPAIPVLQENRQRIAAPPGIPDTPNTTQIFRSVQRKAINTSAASLPARFQPAQMKKNDTGLPDQLKTGIEGVSGIDISDVKVHYNSSQPAALQAHAYAQGTDIHVAPGQEKHLPHEAWHVVQQKQGRVAPTTEVNGQSVNDNQGLEQEADAMGSLAVQRMEQENHTSNSGTEINTLQLHKELHGVARQIDGRAGNTMQLAGDDPGGFLTDGEKENGKMQKSVFLAGLQTEATIVADEELKTIGQTASNCPFIGYWISFYASKPAAQVEKAIHIYASETERVTDASQIISLVAAKIRSKLKAQLAKSALEPVNPSEPGTVKDISGEVKELMPPAQLKEDDVAQLGCLRSQEAAPQQPAPQQVNAPLDARFTEGTYLFSSINNGNYVGSVYFTAGRLRLEHTSKPDIEPADLVTRYLFVEGNGEALKEYYTLFEQADARTITAQDVYDVLKKKGYLRDFAVGTGGYIIEFHGDEGAYYNMHLSGGTPVKVPFKQEHINLLFTGVSTKNNADLRRIMNTNDYLRTILTSEKR